MRITTATSMACLSALMVVSVAINMTALQSNQRNAGRSAYGERLGGERYSTELTSAGTGRSTTATPVSAETAGLQREPATPARPAVLNANSSTAQTSGGRAAIAASAAVATEADTIRGVQRELNARGYAAGSADGVMGLVTRAAIFAYETDAGFETLTATASAELLGRIVLGSSAPSASRRSVAPKTTAEAEAVVKWVKQALATLGYQPGKIDGALTPQLARAIREFELDQKLAESGRISGPLISRAMRLQAQPVKSAPARAAQR